MANKKITVDVDVNTNVDASIKQLKELKKQLREVPTGTAEWKKLYNEIDDLEDKIKGAKQGSSDWIDTLQNAGGPLGMLGRGINNVKVAFTSFNTALKASVIGILVTAIGGLVAAFSQSETAMKKLQPIFIQLQRILGGIFRALEPLLDGFVEFASVVLPYVTKGVGIFYSSLVALFTYIKEAGTGVFKVWKGLLTLDFDMVKEGVSQIGNSFSETAKSYTQTMKRFEMGTKEQTKIEKEQSAERKKNAEDERKKKEEIAQKELEKRKKDLDARIELEKRKESSSQSELKKLLDQRMNLELQNKELTESEKEIIRKDYQKKLEDALKEDSDRQKKRRESELDAIIQLEITSNDTRKEELKKSLDERMNLELQNQELTESEKEVIRQKYTKMLDDAIKEDVRKKNEDRQKKLVDDIQLTRGDIDQQLLLYQQFQDEVLKSEQYTSGEKLRLIQETNQQINQLHRQRFEEEKLDLQNQFLEGNITKQQQLEQDKLRLDQEALYYKDLRDKKKITETEYLQFLNQNKQSQIQIDQELLNAKTANFEATSSLLSGIASLVGEQTKAGKALAIASATIDTYSAANKVLADPTPMPTFLRFALAAGAIVRGLVSVKKIVETKLPVSGGNPNPTTPQQQTTLPKTVNATGRGYAVGGLVRGPGTETSDSIPAFLSDGEFVVNSRSTRLFQPLLQSINDVGLQPKFAVGGLVKGQQRSNENNTENLVKVLTEGLSQQPVRTYVTSTDISNQQQFDRVIKSRSLI